MTHHLTGSTGPRYQKSPGAQQKTAIGHLCDYNKGRSRGLAVVIKPCPTSQVLAQRAGELRALAPTAKCCYKLTVVCQTFVVGHSVQDPNLVGWFRSRRNSSHKVSVREVAVHRSLTNILKVSTNLRPREWVHSITLQLVDSLVDDLAWGLHPHHMYDSWGLHPHHMYDRYRLEIFAIL